MSVEQRAAVIAAGDQQGIDTPDPNGYTVGFEEIDETQVAAVGGKGAHLGALSRIDGIRVPPGFCVTTSAFRRVMAHAPSVDDLLEQLAGLNEGDRNAIGELSAEIRRTLERITVPSLVVQSLADRGVFPSDAHAIHDALAADDKTLELVPGAHYFEDTGPAGVADLVAGWIGART